MGNFAWEILKRIIKDHPEVEFHFLFDDQINKEFIIDNNIKPVVIKPILKDPYISFWIRFQWLIPRYLNKNNIDIFISPDSIFSTRHSCKSIFVLHDLNFVHRPLDLPKHWARFYNKWTPKFLKKASKIITVSEFSKTDISQSFETDPAKIDVVYNAAKSIFKPLTETEKEVTKAKWTSNSDYFVYVGSLHERKNIDGLLKAFDLFKKNTNSNKKLLIVGEQLFTSQKLKSTFDNLSSKADIVFTGRVSDEELAQILGSAFALTFFPFFEGFGIPIIEAFACNTPVLCSNSTSLPEVEGGAAISTDPNNIEGMAYAMQQSLDHELRIRMIERGKEQLKHFNWDESANKFWEIIQKLNNE